jgi:Predicted metal binding domain
VQVWSAEAGCLMYTDPAVVRRKVERELKDFVQRIDHFRARGIWILEYTFPELLVAFVATKVKPYAIAPYGVVMDLRNYDVEPPSIRFVNPMTRAATGLIRARS